MNFVPQDTRALSGNAPLRVLVAHPGRQHSHQLALALQEQGMLARYLHGAPLPEGFAERFLPGIRRFLPVASAIRKTARMVGGGPLDRRAGLWADDLFDRLAAAMLSPGSYDVVVGYEAGCEHLFAAARQFGMRTILDAASLHHGAQRRLLDGLQADPPALAQRKDREIRLADAILTCSHNASASYIAAGINAARLRTVELGAGIDAAAESLPASPVHNGAARFAFVGSYSRHKGADILAEAARQLRDRQVDFDLTVVADPEPGDAATMLARYAECHGRMPHGGLMAFLCDQDFLVLPSRFDSFGLVVGEALSLGCAAIVSDEVGARHLVQSCDGGRVVRAGDPWELAQAMAEMAASVEHWRARRGQISKASRQHGWDRYRRQVAGVVREMALSRKAA